MNNDRFLRLLKRSALVFSVSFASVLLVACGGGSNNKSSSSVSSVSSTSSSSSSSSSVAAAWPGINVTSAQPRTLTFNWTPVEGATHYKLFKNVDGSSGYAQVGDDVTAPTASDTLSVHLHDWINTLYMVEACNETSCEASTPRSVESAMLDAIGFIKASNTEANDWFGWSVALSADGSTLAVGAPAEDSKAVGVNGDQADNTSPSSGAVYVFTQIDGLWAQQAYIKASNTEQPNTDATQTLPNDRFGYRVALSADGSRLVVSALYEDSLARGVNCDQGNFLYIDANDANKVKHLNTNAGAVYVFSRSEGQWSQEAYLKSSNSWADERFGASLAIAGDGNTLAIGTPGEDLNLRGAVMNSSASSECQPANTIPSSASSSSSTSSSSSSSSSSSISSLPVSSSSVSSAVFATNSGAVYVFVRTDGGWSEQALIKASNTRPEDLFGTSVALSLDGSTLAVGAPQEVGKAVGINGDQALDYVITLGNTNFRGYVGAVYLFRRSADTWTQQAYVKPLHVNFLQKFGTGVALSADGNRMAISAPGDLSKATGVNGNAADYELITTPYAELVRTTSTAYGAAYIFSYTDAGWQQDAYIKASNANEFDEFGHSLALSADGSKLAVGTINEASLAKGINGDETDNSRRDTGAVYVYALGENGWQQRSYVKPTNTRGGDRFGADISLSADGGVLAVGGYREPSAATGVNGDRNDASAPSAGAVHLY